MTQLRHGMADGRTNRVGGRLLAAAVALSVGTVALVAGAAPSRADGDPEAVVTVEEQPPADPAPGTGPGVGGRAGDQLSGRFAPGLTQLWPFTKVSATRFDASLPGNMSGFGAVTAIGSSPMAAENSFDYPNFVGRSDSIKSCTQNSREVGKVFQCITVSETLTFPRPVANPSVYVGLGLLGAYDLPDQNWYIRTWVDASITRVNAVTPRAGQVEPVDMTDVSFVPATNTLAPDAGRLVRMETVYSAGEVRIKGMVTSVTISHTMFAAVTINVGGRYQPSMEGIVRTPLVVMLPSVPVADLSISKSAPAQVAAGGTVQWTLGVKNNGAAGSHGFTVQDVVPAGVRDVRLVSGPPGCVLSGATLQCTAAPAGWSVTRDATVPTFSRLSGGDTAALVPEVLAAGASWTPIVLEATVTAPAGSTLSNTATVAGADADASTANNTATATTRVVAAWGITKASTPPSGTVLAPGSTVDYRVEATSTSGQIDTVVLTDNLSDVLDDAVFVPGSARLSIDGGPAAAVPDPTGTTLATPPFTLPAGKSAVLTYRVTVKADAWSASLGNTVTGTGSTPPTTCAPGPSLAPVCSTTNPTFSHVLITKKGTNPSGDIAELVGAEFTLRTDSNGTPGTLVDPGPVAVPGRSGTVEATTLTPGTYWLTETRSPAGHTLLADPVAFTIAANGTLALVDPAAHPQVSIDGVTLTVLDVPALTLPNAGGTGTSTALLAAGAALLLTALVALAGTPATRGATALRARLRRPTRVHHP
ncbi:hypothetical protein AGMMS50218_08860 [Actinomycetota bacterium]|nr:hypothetical protein AGMMS50218_08860 [Actinomycetota bacterium]